MTMNKFYFLVNEGLKILYKSSLDISRKFEYVVA